MASNYPNKPRGKTFEVLEDLKRRAARLALNFKNYNIWKEIDEHVWAKIGMIKSAIKAREWLNDYSRDKRNWVRGNFMTQGKMYIFDYDDPLHKDTLAYWDTNPLIISLGVFETKDRKTREYGLNLHLYPPKIRKMILCTVFDMYKNKYKGDMYRKDQKYVQVELRKLLAPLSRYGVEFAVRMYVPELKRNTIEIRYENWRDAIYIQSLKLNKISVENLVKEWENFVRKKNKENSTKSKSLNESWLRS